MKDVFSEKELQILGEEMDRLRRQSEEISQRSVSSSCVGENEEILT